MLTAFKGQSGLNLISESRISLEVLNTQTVMLNSAFLALRMAFGTFGS